MPMIKWEPWMKERELFPIELPRWMEELMGDGWPLGTRTRFRKTLPEKEVFLTPRIDLFEEKDALIAKVEVPGIEKENLSITVEGDLLTIRGSFKTAEEIKENDYYFAERATGGFLRTLPLPYTVSGETVTATLRHGLLEVRLPKAEETKEKERKIKIT